MITKSMLAESYSAPALDPNPSNLAAMTTIVDAAHGRTARRAS